MKSGDMNRGRGDFVEKQNGFEGVQSIITASAF